MYVGTLHDGPYVGLYRSGALLLSRLNTLTSGLMLTFLTLKRRAIFASS